MRCISIMVLGAALAGCAARPHHPDPPYPAVALAESRRAADRGDFEAAVRIIAAVADRGGVLQGTALLELSSAQQRLGRYDLAVTSLERALSLATERGDDALKMHALNALGVALTFNPAARPPRDDAQSPPDTHHAAHPATAPAHCHDERYTDARAALSAALALARQLGDDAAQASALTNLGNYHARAGRFDEAVRAYDEAMRRAPEDLARARARVNAAAARLTAAGSAPDDATRQAALAQAIISLGEALLLLESVGDIHEKAFLLLTLGQTLEGIAAIAPRAADRTATARDAYDRALAIAERLGDTRMQSYACGYLGVQALARGDLDEADRQTRRAMLAAQRVRSPDALYRWQWQNARILRARWDRANRPEDLAAALTFYEAAVQTVKFIRNDLALGHGNARRELGFRRTLGALYFEYADALLLRADHTPDPQALARLYRQARGTVEQLKAVELEDYFQDECISLIRRRQKTIEDVDGQTAVVYLIPLENRVEILLSFRGGEFYRARNDAADAAGLRVLAERFRRQMTSVDATAGYDYRETGAALYQALIAPVRKTLDQRKITTLVFVPDGPLRAIAMSALVDEQGRHLVESFAIAISPGLELLEPRALHAARPRVLAGGLSGQVPGLEQFAALTFVPDELRRLRTVYPQATILEGDRFAPGPLKRALDARPYTIVHLATHAEFSGSAKESFLLTSEGKMSLDQVERLIRPYQLRNQPVELLTLSACKTAAGDEERAALGLAGIAVKAGARSAVATLWKVNEQASVDVVTRFYTELQGPAVSKARAMQAAQVALIRSSQQYEHPYYWAPFIVIGNWL